MFEDVWHSLDLQMEKQTFTSKTSADCVSIYNKLIENYPSHCSSCIKWLQLNLNSIISPYKIQQALMESKIWFAVRAVFRISFTFLPWKILQAMAVLDSLTINGNSRNQKKKLQSKHNGRAWKARCKREFVVAFYTVWVSGRNRPITDRRGQTGDRAVCWIIGGFGATGVEFVANKSVVKEGSDCCGERGKGVLCVTKGNGGWCRGELILWWRILAPGWVSVAEQQLCRRLHIPGFRGQGCYYCVL